MSALPLIRLPAPSPRIETGRREMAAMAAPVLNVKISERIDEVTFPRLYTGRRCRQAEEGQR